MSGITVSRERAGEEGALQPAPYLCDALVALLEDDPARPIKVQDGLYLRAAAFTPVLIEALETAQAHYEPQSIRAEVIAERIAAYSGSSTIPPSIPKRCNHCDKLMDSAEAEAGDTCGRCSRALSVARSA